MCCLSCLISVEKEKAEDEYSGTDMYNKEYNPNCETEVIHMVSLSDIHNRQNGVVGQSGYRSWS